MAKREEQKHKAGASSRASAKVKTRPLPTLDGGEEKEQSASARQIPQPSHAPEQIRRRQLLIGGAGLAVSVVALGGWLWAETPHHASPTIHVVSTGDLLVTHWNEAVLRTIRAQQSPMPVAARALAIVHTCMYDAWAAYHPLALGTQLGTSLRQSSDAWTAENKSQAISYAAYRALLDLFPGEQARFDALMRRLGYNPSDRSHDSTPAGIGNRAAQAVLESRHHDGANQLGNLARGAYADYTDYQPANTAAELKNPSRWQPLSLPVTRSGAHAQQFECAQWADVMPFALTNATQFMSRQGPPNYPNPRYTAQAQQIVQYSAGLTDEQKVIAEHWATDEEQPASRWSRIAQFISRRDNHTLDQNVQLFFALANADLDTSIACWAAKRAYNAAYPVTAIHYLFKGKQIRVWAGPGKDVQTINGQYWSPYQLFGALMPAFPEYCSEQSAFSAAAAQVLRRFTGSDRLDLSYTQAAHTSRIEPEVPARSITLSWPTLTQAANQAGLAGRYGGIHFTQSDLDGRVLGGQVGEQAWLKAQSYINGFAHT